MSMGSFSNWSLALRTTAVGLGVAIAIDAGLAVKVLTADSSAAARAPFVMRPAEEIVLRTPDDVDVSRQGALRSPFDAGAGVPPVVPGPIAAVAAATVASTAPIVLLGTVLDNQGGFVMVQTPDNRVQLVRVGERTGGYHLRSLSAGQATFEDQTGARTTLRLNTPGTAIRP